jgi:hypothetical protein
MVDKMGLDVAQMGYIQFGEAKRMVKNAGGINRGMTAEPNKTYFVI